MHGQGIIVSPLSAAEWINSEEAPSHIISLLAPDGVRAPIFPGRPHHLVLYFNDIIEPREGMILPDRSHVEEIVRFMKGWHADAPLFIHCWAGISRSTAAAYIALCLFNPGTDEHRLAALLRRHAPEATPNAKLIEEADRLLGRKGRMMQAIERIGRGSEAFEGTPFTLPHPAGV